MRTETWMRGIAAAALAASLAMPVAPACASGPLETSTSVSVAAAELSAAPSGKVSCALSEVASYSVSVTVGNAAGTPTVTWSRTRGDALDPSFSASGEACSLSGVTEAGSYAYTARVVDGWGREASATVEVEVSADEPVSDYVQGAAADPATGVQVAGSIHRSASLSVRAVAADDAACQRLQASAGGRGVSAAWTVSLSGVPEGVPAFQGVLTVELPAVQAASLAAASLSRTALGAPGSSVGSDALAAFSSPRAAAPPAASVDVLLLPEGGGDAVLLRGGLGAGTVTVSTGALGAFALLGDAPASYTVEASAGLGGRVEPSGAVELAAGATQVFAFYPDGGYRLSAVSLDGRAVEVEGNSLSVGPVDADHVLRAEFERVPFDPSRTHVLRTSAGPGGRVDPDTGDAGVQVAHGASQLVRFLPDEGCRLSRVLVNGREVSVEGDAYLIAAMESDTDVRAEFEALPPATAVRPLSTGSRLSRTGDELPVAAPAAALVLAALALAAAGCRLARRRG